MGMGGKTQTASSSSGIDPEFKPFLKDVLGDVTQRYKDERAGGHEAIVAGLNPVQQEAMAAQAQLGRDQAQGLTDSQIANALSQQAAMSAGQASGQGTLNSTWGQKAAAQAQMQKALELQALGDQRRQSGAHQLGQTGMALQQQRQKELDAPHTSAQRYFGYLGSAPQQSTSTQPKGGK